MFSGSEALTGRRCADAAWTGWGCRWGLGMVGCPARCFWTGRWCNTRAAAAPLQHTGGSCARCGAPAGGARTLLEEVQHSCDKRCPCGRRTHGGANSACGVCHLSGRAPTGCALLPVVGQFCAMGQFLPQVYVRGDAGRGAKGQALPEKQRCLYGVARNAFCN